MQTRTRGLDTAVAELPYGTGGLRVRDYAEAYPPVRKRALNKDDTCLLAFAKELVKRFEAEDTEQASARDDASPASYLVEADDTIQPTAPEAFSDEAEDDEEEMEDPEVARASASRTVLLAQQFARSHLSREHLARLEILEERLRALSPLVEEASLTQLEQAQQRLTSSSELLARIDAELARED